MCNRDYSPKSLEIIFHEYELRSDLFRYLDREDVLVLLNRLSLTEYEHLKSVTIKTCRGANTYGKVYFRRIRGIVICDQPQRFGIKLPDARLGSLDEYGALVNCKWPSLAVRRFLLYNVFLHELRHTQLLVSQKERTRDKIPKEKWANDYSDFWRGELYKEKFEHPDPVHNLPSAREIEQLQRYWPTAVESMQQAGHFRGRKEYEKAKAAYQKALDIVEMYYQGLGGVNRDAKKINELIWLMDQKIQRRKE